MVEQTEAWTLSIMKTYYIFEFIYYQSMGGPILIAELTWIKCE